MFSCCRANPKNAKSNKKDKSKKTEDDEEEQTETNDKKLIIPTITIENGKTNDGNGGSSDIINGTTNNEAAPVASADSASSAAPPVQDYVNPVKSENEVNLCSQAVTDVPDIAKAQAESAIVANQQNAEPHHGKSSTSLSTTATTVRAINQTNGTTEVPPPPSFDAVSDAVQQLQNVLQQYETEQLTSNHDTLPPKSCLSRHNSTHTSIKKKVNISTHAEIIEPDPLPPPPYDHASLADDDDVFSDSLPPPKRESMCAPYIERDDMAPDSVTFAHCLPEWFNDERIHDIGCIEPPVTPVGRDELELKHQRLYADLLRAAHAAVEHSMRYNASSHTYDMFPYNGDANSRGEGDCDPDLKPSVAENLEHLVNRLERLVERLERSVSARELEIANRTFDTVLEQKRASFDLETTDLPPAPVETLSEQLTQQANTLDQRIERIESSLSRINYRHSSSLSASLSQNSQTQQQRTEGSLENIPTVLEDYQVAPNGRVQLEVEEEEESLLLLPPPPSMSVLGYQDIVSGPLSQYLALSTKIGGDVAKHADLVKAAFNAQLQYVTLATQCAQPSQDKQMELLKPTSTQISAIQDFREKNRASPYFNHLSAISESIPALGWVCVSPTPGPHVKEMNDAGQFYTNRVLKEWKEKDAKHVEWARAWVQTLTELQAYIKQYHTTGLVWSGKGGAPAGRAAPPPPPIGSCPPPPPPPAFDLAAMSLEGGVADERGALFAEINQGEAITKNLKKVTADMQTHKNPTLRTGPAPFKTPTQFGAVGSAGHAAPTVKAPVFTRDGKKWLIEYQKNNTGLLVENAEMNNVVYVFKCEGSTLTVKGKVNNIVLDSCKKCSLVFESVVASVEFVNCQSVQMQTLGFVPTISIDKTDGCQMYLSQASLGVEIVSSKSSEMNVMLVESNGDYTELAVPEQYKTTISGKTLKTVCVDSLG